MATYLRAYPQPAGRTTLKPECKTLVTAPHTFKPRGILAPMFRRAQAILLVLALLATPLALYARVIASDVPNCNGMCCLPQHHRTPQPAPTEPPAIAVHSAPAADSDCPHHHATPTTKASAAQNHANAVASEAASHSCAFYCAMHSKPRAMTFGLLAPIAPTKPSDLAAIRIAIDTTRAIAASTDFTPSGFLASPFQPPRA
jgi:hypothetical protein